MMDDSEKQSGLHLYLSYSAITDNTILVFVYCTTTKIDVIEANYFQSIQEVIGGEPGLRTKYFPIRH